MSQVPGQSAVQAAHMPETEARWFGLFILVLVVGLPKGEP